MTSPTRPAIFPRVEVTPIITLRFSIPHRVARVVDFSEVARLAREGSVVQPGIAQTRRHVERRRVTCSPEAAGFLVPALQRVATGAEQVADREPQDAAATAMTTVLSAKDMP